jgi:8-oxo-dGTP diphosphatase
MDPFRNAAKAFIVKNGKLLLIKRRPNDPHKPNAWDIPGGRLELGEDPFEGLKRETKEETQLQIEIIMPISVHHFVREDGQKITLTIYLCESSNDNIVLSEEHTEYEWVDLSEAPSRVSKFFEPTFANLARIKL